MSKEQKTCFLNTANEVLGPALDFSDFQAYILVVAPSKPPAAFLVLAFLLAGIGMEDGCPTYTIRDFS